MLVIYIHRLHRLTQNIIYRLVIPGTTGNPGFSFTAKTQRYCLSVIVILRQTSLPYKPKDLCTTVISPNLLAVPVPSPNALGEGQGWGPL